MSNGVQTEQKPLDGTFLSAPPMFFSAAFHLRFLPRVIAFRIGQYRRRDRQAREHVLVEVPLLVFACILLVAMGLAPAIDSHSIPGTVSCVLGGGGLLALVAWSLYGEYRVRRQEGYRYDYAVFMPTVFFFCLVLGASAGLIGGAVIANSIHVGYLWALIGLAVGYLAGIFAARWVHALGFMAAWFIYLAILGLVFLPIEDLMVIWIFASKDQVWTGG